MRLHAAVISAGRPEVVDRYGADGWTYYVPPGDRAAYEERGATTRTVEGLVAARNLAMEDAFSDGATCFQLSDDLADLRTRFSTHPDLAARARESAQEMATIIDGTGVYYAGVPFFSNEHWAKQRPMLSFRTWVDGDFIIIRPNPIRFDPDIPLSESVDYALAHLHEYGRVARFNHVLATFRHRKNSGGCQEIRAARPDLENESHERVMAKYPCCVTFKLKKGETYRQPVIRFRQVHCPDVRGDE